MAFIGTVSAPPLVYEAHRGGEALMMASILVFWAYGRGVSFRSGINVSATVRSGFGARRERFFAMFFLDYLLNRYDPALAYNVRKGADGIG